ncbi:MAG: hypothetical protein KGP28_03820 [Bdellovibrionales bacterium]|nr:hypothetical protein [Bdellovibrionales bacterium]
MNNSHHSPLLAFLILTFTLLVHPSTLTAAPSANQLRSKVGSVFSAPALYQKKLYFVSTSGVLYESDPELKKITKLKEGKKQTTGALTLFGDTLYWGEGLHGDTRTVLHSFDLKQKKALPDLTVDGHIERPILVSGDALYLPTGPGGLVKITKKTMKEVWRAKSHDSKPLHVDSNLVEYGEEICATTIYDLKGVICFDKGSGKETRFHDLKKDPKGQISLSGDMLVGFATAGNLLDPKFDIPSDFYVLDLKSKKMRFVKELRGFNFFAPPIEGSEAFLTLSTGDFILFNLENEKITFLGEFSEPFINPPFRKDSEYCGIGIMGKFTCYTKTQNGAPAISKDTRILETVIGQVSQLGSNIYVPTRISYIIL